MWVSVVGLARVQSLWRDDRVERCVHENVGVVELRLESGHASLES